MNEIVARTCFTIGNTAITPIPIKHGNLDILGYRIHNFVYITDASFINEKQFVFFENVEILIINALRLEKHHAHFNLKEALAFIKLVKPERAYLTHISHHFRPQKEWRDSLPANVSIAYDGLVL